ncbi:MAG: CPBP family intramembrane glutamic endopeptidase [Candidatus Thorarchaeota archaeon]|jgi:membrane protease YdiL (CAAX protease family)
MGKKQLTVSTTEIEDPSKSTWNHIPLLALAGLFLFIGVVLRNIDVFLLGLSESWINILPSKLIPLLIILGFFWFYRRTQIASVLGLKIEEPRKHVAIGIILGVALFLMGNVVASVIYWAFIDSSQGLNVTIIRPDLLWYSAIFFLINAVYEEILFRGALQNGLREYMSVNMAILSSAVIFGIYHIIWPIYFAGSGTLNTSQIFVYVVFSGLLGAVFGIYYEKFSSRRTLLGPIFAHWLINFLNENIKISSSEVIAGPDVLLGNPPIQMAMALLLVIILYSTSIIIFSKYRVENLEGWLQRRRAQFSFRAKEVQ